MQTTHPNDDMYADFFQVGGYRNFGSFSANIMAGNKGNNSFKGKFSDIAKRGKGKTFLSNAFKPFSRVYDEIKGDFELSDFRINQLWGEHRSQGGKLADFKEYVSQVEKNKVAEQTINEQNTLPNMDSIDISDVDFEEKKSGVPLVYVGIGAVVLVGITILIVKKL